MVEKKSGQGSEEAEKNKEQASESGSAKNKSSNEAFDDPASFRDATKSMRAGAKNTDSVPDVSIEDSSTSKNPTKESKTETKYRSAEWQERVLSPEYRNSVDRNWVENLVPEPFEALGGHKTQDQQIKRLQEGAAKASAKLKAAGIDMKIEVIPTERYSPADQGGADFFFKVTTKGKSYYKPVDLKQETVDIEGSTGKLRAGGNTRLPDLGSVKPVELKSIFESGIKSGQLTPEPPQFERLIRGASPGAPPANSLTETKKLLQDYAEFLSKQKGFEVEAQNIQREGGALDWLRDKIKQMDAKVATERKIAESDRRAGEASRDIDAETRELDQTLEKSRAKTDTAREVVKGTSQSEKESERKEEKDAESKEKNTERTKGEKLKGALDKTGKLGILLMMLNMLRKSQLESSDS